MPWLVGAAALAQEVLVQGQPVSWSLPAPPGHVALVELSTPQGDELTRFVGADGSTRDALGWLPDRDPAEGRLRLDLEALWLAPGRYRLTEVTVAGREEHDLLVVPGEVPRQVDLRLPPNATAVSAWRDGATGGHDAYAWTSAWPAGRAILQLGHGEWWVVAHGGPSAQAERLPSSAVRLDLPETGPSAGGSGPASPWFFRLALLPTGLLLGLAGARWAWRSRRTPGLRPVLALSALLGLAVVWPVSGDPTGRLLQGATRDPTDSVAQLATMAEALPRLAAAGRAFSWPDGASWLTTGPAWLGYAVPSLAARLVGPLAAQSVGIALGAALLALGTWVLARTRGASPWAATLAAPLAVLAPGVLGEWDAMSLDRATLGMVPLALALLARPRDRRAASAAGLALGAVIYGQVYYGLFLALAAPLLVLPDLPGPGWRARTGRAALAGAVALVVMGPALGWLAGGIGVAVHQEAPALAEAVRAAVPLAELLRPDALFPGRDLFWPLAALAILAAAPRRPAAALAWQVLVLSVFALGPSLDLDGARIPLPQGLAWHWLPGFDRLKNVHRFAILATVPAAALLALGLDGVHRRLGGRAWLVPVLAGLGLVGLPFLRVPLLGRHLPADLDHTPRLVADWPAASAWPLPPALLGLEGGVALALPVSHPTPARVAVPAVRSRLWLVNEPPFEVPAQQGLSALERHPLLARLAWLSGSERARRPTGWSTTLGAADRDRLVRDGLAFVLLYRQLLAGPELAPGTEALLDALAERIADDGAVAVWRLR